MIEMFLPDHGGSRNETESTMPAMHVALAQANGVFGDPALLIEHRAALLERFAPNADHADIASYIVSAQGPLGKPLSGNLNPGLIGNLAGKLPATVMEVSRAVIHQNLQRETPLGMTFAWMPAYEHEITVCESPATDYSPGWITILMRGLYPTDPHPITGVAIDGTTA
jgi:hypothetical protein